MISVAQDWVPILDKVFGQKWCSDLWQIKELASPGGAKMLAGGAGLLRDAGDGVHRPGVAESHGRSLPFESARAACAVGSSVV